MGNIMIKELLKAANGGEAIRLYELRESCENAGDCIRIVIRLDNGRRYDRELYLPRPKDGEEREFVRDHLRNCVYNLIAALGGHSLRFFIPEGEGLEELIGELREIFGLEASERCGHGKCVSVSNRINASLGFGKMRFDIAPLCEYIPEPSYVIPADLGLAARLRKAAESACEGLYCGIDVGGTDIKFVAVKEGEIISVREYDWDPSAFKTAAEIISPILALVAELREVLGGVLLDGIGMCFPDVVINDLIVGGETPKTKGMRENPYADYETEFKKLSGLADELRKSCKPNAPVRIINDGFMTAFSAAAELACEGRDIELSEGVFAVSLGTDLGSGLLEPDGSIPPIPFELYDMQLDLGSIPQRERPAEDIRSIRNENSGLPGVRRYLGQAAVYRMAMELEEALIEAYVEKGEVFTVPSGLRKPCLEHVMRQAEAGNGAAEEIFRRVGENLGVVFREAEYILGRLPARAFVFGRFVKHARCFELINEGFKCSAPAFALTAADDSMAFSAVMKALRAYPGVTVAQFAQAVGCIYLANTEK